MSATDPFQIIPPQPANQTDLPIQDTCLNLRQDPNLIQHLELTHGHKRFLVRTICEATVSLPPQATHFGFVQQGPLQLEGASGSFQVGSRMYFSQPGQATLRLLKTASSVREQPVREQPATEQPATEQPATEAAAQLRALVITQLEYEGFFHLGGPSEGAGRLHYIDGCSDSLLIPPIVRGEACLNLLHIPPQTQQTQHTHPSFRVGIIVDGTGVCRTPHKQIPLRPGLAFAIAAEGLHSFHTAEDSLTVIAFHPDSDCGPTHQNHPMINRTIVDGVSAAQLQHIHSR